jgi:hypothetical protein
MYILGYILGYMLGYILGYMLGSMFWMCHGVHSLCETGLDEFNVYRVDRHQALAFTGIGIHTGCPEKKRNNKIKLEINGITQP